MGTPLTDVYGAYAPSLNIPQSVTQYTTPKSAGIPVFENAHQFTTSTGTIKRLDAFNNSDDEVYVMISDTDDGDNPAAGDKALEVVTIPSKGFMSIFAGDISFSRGLYGRAFTDAALTTPAGNVMSWSARWTVF